MKQKHQSMCLAGLLALAVGLSACSSWRGGSMGSSGSSGSAGDTGSSGTATGTSNSGGMSGTGAGMMQNQGASAMPTSPNATVAAIEVLPRSSSSATEGNAGTSAAAVSSTGSSSGGATGSSADRIYRVTLRMDDGSTQVVTQQTTPDFRTGDRVSLAGGMIQH